MPDALNEIAQALEDSFETAQEMRDELRAHDGPKLAEDLNTETGLRKLAGEAVRHAFDHDPEGKSEIRQLVLAALRAKRGTPALLEAASRLGLAIPAYLRKPPERVFRLRVIEKIGGKFEVNAEAGGKNEKSEPKSFDREFEANLARLGEVLADSAAARRATLLQHGNQHFDKTLLRELGDNVFEFLLTGDVLRLFKENLQAGDSTGARLQVMLDAAEAPSLAHIPWELAFDPKRKLHLCLLKETSVARRVEAEVKHWQPRRKLRFLGFVSVPDASGPDGPFDPLLAERERDRIRKALERLTRPVEQIWSTIGSKAELNRLIRGATAGSGWSVFHFIGHGGFDPEANEGFLLFQDAAGTTRVNAEWLAMRLLEPGATPQLVVLNCCSSAMGAKGASFSSVAESLVLKGIPAVIAMQFPISSGAAVCFSESFYGAIAEGMSVQEALTQARQAMSDEFPEWVTPAIFTYSGDFPLVEPEA